MKITREEWVLFDDRNSYLVKLMNENDRFTAHTHINHHMRNNNLYAIVDKAKKDLSCVAADALIDKVCTHEDNIGNIDFKISCFILTPQELYQMLEKAYSIGRMDIKKPIINPM